ncbi:hypothetical protein ILYODFUR_012485 [Ilyodon furcidens]|uniref:Uncharacterized protein n=1 Tax=Ilyodon furcidens TaxID=33524 RepID=A0ABV0UT85_9TELE
MINIFYSELLITESVFTTRDYVLVFFIHQQNIESSEFTIRLALLQHNRLRYFNPKRLSLIPLRAAHPAHGPKQASTVLFGFLSSCLCGMMSLKSISPPVYRSTEST